MAAKTQSAVHHKEQPRGKAPAAAGTKGRDDIMFIVGCALLFIIIIPLQLFGAPRFYTMMGKLREADGELTRAVDAYDRVLAVWPRLFDADEILFKRAVLLMSTEESGSPRLADAEADLRSLLVSQPDNANVHFNLGIVLGELVDAGARAADAEPHFLRALALTEHEVPEDRARRHEGFGRLLSSLGRHEEAKRELERALDLHSTGAALRISYAAVLHAAGDLKSAIAAYGTAMDTAASDGSIETMDRDEATAAYNNFAAALQEAGELKRAKLMYERAMALSPESAHGRRARVNLDKLPVSDAYRAAAARETHMLAHRAAMAALAAPTAQRAQKQASAGRETKSRRRHARQDDMPELTSVQLFRTVRYLRRLETEELSGGEARGMWHARGLEMPEIMSTSTSRRGDKGPRGGESERKAAKHEIRGSSGGSDDGGADSTLKAFAWGGVWFHSAWLPACNRHPTVRSAISHALQTSGKSAAVLGSSIGFEAYFIALTYGLPTVGVELLCGLVDLSERVRRAHRIASDAVRFECADALMWELPSDLALVYVDDTAWDAATVERMAERLGRELPSGAVVIHNGGEAAYGKVRRLRKLQSVSVATSWSDSHEILVHVVVGP